MKLQRIRQLLRDERGSILALVALSLVVLLGMGGLALDSGWAYVRKAELSRAVDAGVLAAARTLRTGRQEARKQAIAVAVANGVPLGTAGIDYDLHFGSNGRGEELISMTASRPVPTLLTRVLGFEEVRVRSAAVAAVKPVDLVLVLDQSGSLVWEDCAGGIPGQKAFECLQEAAKIFVDQFNNGIDQLALVSFQIRAETEFAIGHGFKNAIKSDIDDLEAVGDTNAGEGLRLAFDQLQSPSIRPYAVKVVVFFTDGRPTAFRDQIDGQDRILAVYNLPDGGNGLGSMGPPIMRGRFDSPDALSMDEVAVADACQDAPPSQPCLGWVESTIREHSRIRAEETADAIRAQGTFIFTVGLGNPNANHPLQTPDMDHLRRLANVEGVSDPDEPRGQAYFAESGAKLEEVFRRLAQDLTVRLAR